MSRESLYLRDLGVLLKDMAHGARIDRANATESDRGYALGRLMALVEVISTMQQQAQAFGIDLEIVGLNDIDPEKDLL